MSDQVVEADIVIIGSGAGGGEAAKLLSKHFNVVIVEEGPHRTSNDFKMKESIAYPELYQDSGARLTVDGAIKILQGKVSVVRRLSIGPRHFELLKRLFFIGIKNLGFIL